MDAQASLFLTMQHIEIERAKTESTAAQQKRAELLAKQQERVPSLEAENKTFLSQKADFQVDLLTELERYEFEVKWLESTQTESLVLFEFSIPVWPQDKELCDIGTFLSSKTLAKLVMTQLQSRSSLQNKLKLCLYQESAPACYLRGSHGWKLYFHVEQ
jgi:hypothetical protein